MDGIARRLHRIDDLPLLPGDREAVEAALAEVERSIVVLTEFARDTESIWLSVQPAAGEPGDE